MKVISHIFLNAIPVLLMIILIPLIANDYLLTILYIIIISFALYIKINKNDLKILMVGFSFMTISEAIFISSGVESFNRTTLFGLMPLWLPFLWGYGFVAIKRTIEILNTI